MSSEKFDVIVIGGGSTATAIARDLSMRGARVLLLERHDIPLGATGRCHGMLHSGGRYAVKDPESATECAKENKVLRRIARHIVEPLGGYFVSIPPDPPEFADKFVEGCKKTGVEFHEMTVEEALREEPNLNPNIQRVFWVNDGAIDPMKFAILMALDAARNNAVIKTHTEVIDLLFDGKTVGGVKAYNHLTGQVERYKAEIVVNAAGAWAGEIAAMAGVYIPIVPNKGTMVVIQKRILNHLVNRLRRPTDGDIIVPHHTTAIIGTTSINVDDPDKAYPTKPEVVKMFKAAVEIAPIVKKTRILRAYAAPRPLIGAVGVSGREISRTFKVFDHEETDNIEGFVSIGGGKMCTARLMAEKLSDLVARKLGLRAPCRTHVEPLPGAEDEVDIQSLARKYGLYNSVAARAATRWGTLAYEFLDETVKKPELKALVCTCELVTAAEIKYAIEKTWAVDIIDVRRRCRTLMGTCQGQNCTYKVAALIHELTGKPIEKILDDIALAIRYRWFGEREVFYRDQLRQAALKLGIYNTLGNLDRLIGM